MIISHTHKFIFFSAPKTGSETVRAALRHLNQEKVVTWRQRTPTTPYYSHMSPSELNVVFEKKGINLQSYRTLVCIRNPFERLVSLYRMYLDVGRTVTLKSRLRPNLYSFSHWISDLEKSRLPFQISPHQRWLLHGLTPIENWIKNGEGTVLVNTLLRTQDISSRLPEVAKKIGLPNTVLPKKLNVRARADVVDKWYTQKTYAVVQRVYKKDIRLLDKTDFS